MPRLPIFVTWETSRRGEKVYTAHGAEPGQEYILSRARFRDAFIDAASAIDEGEPQPRPAPTVKVERWAVELCLAEARWKSAYFEKRGQRVPQGLAMYMAHLESVLE